MIFGSGSSKIHLSGSETVLYHSNIRPNWCEQNIRTIESIYDHYTTFQNLGDYSDFWVDINLFKYDSDGNGTGSIAKMNELYPTYLYQNVYFWPHIDGNAVSGSDGKPVVYFVKEFNHSYLNNDPDAGEDLLSIHLTSNDYTTITGSLV